ncbi:DUF3857 domain-containing protein [Mucilaginibacter litoreus]|uniref:DUF3857 domain-containing protein n=1 Tax=Mucilaginibacter litoreus TaxID=1048221 RepID=A0ABW3AVU4_9SPHI
MSRFYILFFLLVTLSTAKAQTNYSVSLIPKALMPYASAVVRDENIVTEVKDNDDVIYHYKKAITVLNKNGDDIAHIVLFYDKMNALKGLKGITYNEFGKQVGKFGEKDFSDESAISGYSLYEDSRVKHLIPSIGSYPYTIEYECEIRSKQTLMFRDWEPVPQTGLAVEKSAYTFICKPDFKIRYKEINMPATVVTGTTKEGFKTYTWQVNNLKALRPEPLHPLDVTYLSRVKIAPVNFAYGRLTGSFSNWKELGLWNYNNLLAGRDQLLPQTVERVKDLTANITDAKQKAKAIYEFMQGKTNYISVQVGIGGYMPTPALDVDNLKYGDCKALVNYTQALLKVAGIESWYCVVTGDEDKISLMPDFASMNQGNHIILCLPFKNDTTFLECTSQKMPFGFLSDFTDDRTVLACTPQGGKLLHTPKYLYADNLQARKAAFSIAPDGTLKGNIATTYKGTQYDNIQSLIDEASTEQVKTIRKMYSSITNLDVEKVDIKQDKKQMPVATENINLTARDFASEDNGKLYFSLNPLNRQRPVRDVHNRITPVYINRGYTDDDEIIYDLPAGYHPDMEQLNVNLNTTFGKYQANTFLVNGKLIYKRHIELWDGTYKPEAYAEVVNFYQKVADTDNYNVTLVKD